MGLISTPPVSYRSNISTDFNNQITKVNEGVNEVHFVAELVKGVEVSWTGILLDQGQTLLLNVPDAALPEGSKEIFVRILEYAEERLGCSRVLTAFPKEGSNRALFMRTFMYFGFSLLAPSAVPQSIDPDHHVVMLYNID